MRPLTALVAALTCVSVGAGVSACTSNPSARPTNSPSSTAVSSSDSASTPASPTTRASARSAYDRVQAWYAGVATHFAAIQSVTESIRAAAAASNAAALPNLCAQLQHDVTVVDSDPAPPDKLMAASVIASMNAYGGAARSCLAGDYAATATGINQGAAYLSKANEIMNNLS